MLFSIDTTYFLIALLIILAISYECSYKFRYYVKFIIYYIGVMSVSVLIIPVICWRPGNVKNTLLATLPLQLLNPLLGMHWEIRGEEHIKPDRAVVVVANHQSSLDFLGMVYMWPIFNKISAIAKNQLFYVLPFGFTAWLCGTRFVDRSDPQKAKDSMNAALNYCKENKVKLWVFPEGTRNMEPEMLSFKKGAFYLAISGQIPILPLVYSSYTGFLSHPLKIWNPGQVIVTCLPPIETAGLAIEDMPKLMEDVRMQMMKKFTEVSATLKPPLRTQLEKRIKPPLRPSLEKKKDI